MSETLTRTTCPYCGVGCGVAVRENNGEILPVAGDDEHPANRGRLCVKGSALHETLGIQRRLLYPELDGQRVSWESALDAVATRLRSTLARHGPRSAALYLSGQLLTEDYYVANKLWKGFIGSANVDTNSRLCMSSAVAAQQRAFGEDVVPACYEDIELADLVILIGSNAAWAHPVLHQRLLRARAARPDMKLVVIDPRRTESCDQADLHLPIKPGADAFLFNGLLAYLARHDAIDSEYVRAHTQGFEQALAAASVFASTEELADICGLECAQLEIFFQWFAKTPRTVTLFSQGINQSSSGTDKGNAIINCHLATGRVGRPGASPFSITGQPNAMGGREAGGLANQLAVHRGFSDDDVNAVAAFWKGPSIAREPGLKAVPLFEAIERGEVKFLWILATNPLVSLPDAERWQRALARCETVVISDCVRVTDTTQFAHILLPAAGWGEKNGTVTNSERRISRQRSFLPMPGEVRPDWWAISEVARRLGFGADFNYHSARDIFVEHAALSGINRDTPLCFDISALAELSADQYDALLPQQWPLPAGQQNHDSTRLFGDGLFATPDRRARFIAIEPRWPVARTNVEAPLLLNTGRVRDHWHTMTRTAQSERLNRHRSEPFVEIHPDDARKHFVTEGDIVELSNNRGRVWLRARIDPNQQRGSLFAPMHWNDQFAARARVGVLVAPVTDPLSGQPELKHTAVALRRWAVRWQALLLSCTPLTLERDDYWAGIPVRGGWVYWLAGTGSPMQARERLGVLFDAEPDLQFSAETAYIARLAWMEDTRLRGALLLGAGAPLPDPWWLADKLGQPLTDADRRVLLTGRPSGERIEQGALICSCFQVGENSIRTAIAAGCASSDELGAKLRCGTNCGSCIPELNRLLREFGPERCPISA